MKIQNINIQDYKVFKNFNINFLNTENEVLDLVVLAGINGSGKTTLFEFITDIINYDDSNVDGSIELNTEELTLNHYNLPKILNFRGHISHKLNELYAEKAVEVGEVLWKKIIYFKVSVNQKEKVIKQIKNFIDMIKDNNEELTIKAANQKAVNEINSIFDGLVLKTKFKGISKDIKRDILFENDVKEDIKLDELSTGEQQLFIRALSLKMMGLQDSIILIDEPEISLHPNWQNHILRVYQNIAKDGDNQLIIATHSPQIVSSAPNESLRVLVKNGTDIEVKSFDKSYGAEIEEVLADFMDTKYLRTPEVAKKVQKMWDCLHNQDLDNFEKVYKELVNILDLNDKDLVLARLEKAKQLSLK